MHERKGLALARQAPWRHLLHSGQAKSAIDGARRLVWPEEGKRGKGSVRQIGCLPPSAVFTRHDGGGGDRDKFGRKPQIKAALKKAAGFCRGSAKTLHELNE